MAKLSYTTSLSAFKKEDNTPYKNTEKQTPV